VCKLRLYIRRDNLLELIKNLGPLVVVGYVPVLTLWLNPAIPPLVGGRVSAHIFSMVLVMVKYNSNLGLGILTSMIWIDIFYLCLFCIIAIGLFETILIHSLFRSDMAVWAITIDGIFRKLMPACIYPCIMGSAFLVGLQMPGTAMALSVGGISVFILIGVVVSYRKVLLLHSKRRKAVMRIVELQTDDVPDEEQDDEMGPLLKEAFDLFDVDGSGKLDRKEIRLILTTMYPGMSLKQQHKCMQAVDDRITEVAFGDFNSAFEEWQKIAAEAITKAPGSRLSRVSSIQNLSPFGKKKQASSSSGKGWAAAKAAKDAEKPDTVQSIAAAEAQRKAALQEVRRMAGIGNEPSTSTTTSGFSALLSAAKAAAPAAVEPDSARLFGSAKTDPAADTSKPLKSDDVETPALPPPVKSTPPAETLAA